ncbi:MFS transporter [Paenibacillus sp. JX-17]|uniref:MFS transporter n=1 Tax=Paenibacillus lacisoli TaxID=3064525 RepID=A0ABT9CB40_9BACL|nr:MFS transporter [Paenibacillus sp. JX-17]MDO7906457.1 MFS transporter [Paenibacillus sp. JX-17]
MKRLVWMGSLFYLLMGFIKVTVASVITELLPLYGKQYSDAGSLVLIEFSAALAGMLLQPVLAARLPKKMMLHSCMWLLTASYIFIGLLPSWAWLLVIITLIGFLGGIVESLIAALIIGGVKQNTAIAMSRLEVSFGIGSLLFPLAVGALIAADQWNLVLFGVAVYCAILSVVLRSLKFEEAEPLFRPRPAEVSAAPTVQAPVYGGTRKVLPAFILIFFLYGGVDTGLVHFLPSMMVESGMMDEPMAPLSVTLFWTTMIIGRLYAGHLAEQITYRKYLLLHWTAAMVFLAWFAVNPIPWISYMLILLIGLAISGIYSNSLVFAKHMMPERVGRMTSLIMAACAIGGGLVSLTAGWMMDHLSVYYVHWMMTGIAGLSLLVYVVKIRANLSSRHGGLTAADAGEAPAEPSPLTF